jgi:hypothetical protein
MPALEELALSYSKPWAAVELVLAALSGSERLRTLCVHQCQLGERQVQQLALALSDAAMRSLRACRLSTSHGERGAVSKLLVGALASACHVVVEPGACMCSIHQLASPYQCPHHMHSHGGVGWEG